MASKKPRRKVLPRFIKPVSAKFTFWQDKDCCDGGECDQMLEVNIEDGGGGCYACIKTERWAIDEPTELSRLVAWCISLCRGSYDDGGECDQMLEATES